MSDSVTLEPTRRAFLKTAGMATGLVVGGGLGSLGLFGRRPWADWDFKTTATALWDDLSPIQRRAICLPWDHPARQLINHVACIGTPRVASILTAHQQALVYHLYETMVSDEYRRRFGRLVGLEGGGLDPCEFVMYGDPRSENCVAGLYGGHLMIRGGGITKQGSAFGGPIAYGHQIGNGTARLPGNAFAYHGDAANEFFASLAPFERMQAVVSSEPPKETVVQLMGPDYPYPGLAARDLSDRKKQAFEDLVEVVLSCYAPADQAAAMGCIERNGGIEALHLVYYGPGGIYDDGAVWTDLAEPERAVRGDPYWHVWRIEGPSTVLHFRGWPHVHASIHVADHAGANQNVGEVLATTATPIEGEALRSLLQNALRSASGEALAYYPLELLMARWPAGPITTGLVWSLDPYDDELAVAEIRGDRAPPELRAQLEAQGIAVEENGRYRVAAFGYVAGQEHWMGETVGVEKSGLQMRSTLEAYFRADGLQHST